MPTSNHVYVYTPSPPEIVLIEAEPLQDPRHVSSTPLTVPANGAKSCTNSVLVEGQAPGIVAVIAYVPGIS